MDPKKFLVSWSLIAFAVISFHTALLILWSWRDPLPTSHRDPRTGRRIPAGVDACLSRPTHSFKALRVLLASTDIGGHYANRLLADYSFSRARLPSISNHSSALGTTMRCGNTTNDFSVSSTKLPPCSRTCWTISSMMVRPFLG
jgi:hypothetical protein